MYGQISINVEGEKSKSFPIKNTETYIGRDRVCEIRLDHPDVALRHCVIIVSEGGFPATVHNLCERTPALLNGRLIFPSDSQLKDGDIITIGPRKLEWSYNKRCLPSTWSDVKGSAGSVKRTRSSEPVHKQRLVAIVSPHRNDERDLPPKKRRKTMFSNMPSSSTSSSISTSSSSNSTSHHHRSPHHHHHLVHNGSSHHHLPPPLNYSSVLDFSRRNTDTSSRSNDSAARNSPLNRPNVSYNTSGTNNQTVTSRIPLRFGQNRGRSVTSSSQGTIRPPRVTYNVPSSSRTNRPVQNQLIPSTSRLLPTESVQRDHGGPSTSANSSIPRARILKIRTPHKISIINDIAISVQPIDLRSYKKETERAKSIPYFYVDKARYGNSSAPSTSGSRHVQPPSTSGSRHVQPPSTSGSRHVQPPSTSGSRHIQPSTSNETPHSRKTHSHNVKKGKSRRSESENRASQSNTSTSSSNESKKIHKIETDTRKIPFYIMRRKRARTPLDSELYSDSEEEPNMTNESPPSSRKTPGTDTEQGTIRKSETESSTENRELLPNASGSSSNETNNIQRIESDTRKIPFYYMRRKIVNSSDVESFYDDSSEDDVGTVKNTNQEAPNKSSNSITSIKTESPETYHTPQNEVKRKTNSSTDKSKKKTSIITNKVSSAVKKPQLRLKSSKKSNSLRIQQGDSSSQSSYITTKSPDSSPSLIKSVNMTGSIIPETPFNNQDKNNTSNTSSTQMPVTPPNDGKYQILMRSSKRESFRRKMFNRSIADHSFTLQNNSVSPVERNSVKFNASAMDANSSARPTTPPNLCSPKIVMRSSKKESLKKLALEKSKNLNDTPLSKHSLNPKLSSEYSSQIFKDKPSEFENLLDSPLTRSKISVISFDSSQTAGSSRLTQPKLSETLPSTSTAKLELPSCSRKTVNNSVDDKLPEKLKTPLITNSGKKSLSKSVEIPRLSKNNIQRVCKSFNEKFDRTEIKEEKSRTNSKERISRISNRNMDTSVNDTVDKSLKGDSSKENINNVSKVSKKNSNLINSNASSCDDAISPVYSNSSNKSFSHVNNKSGALKDASRVSFMDNKPHTSWQMKSSRKSTFKTPRSQKHKRTQVNIGANKIITSTPRTAVDRTPIRIVWDLLAEVDSNTPSDCSSPQGKKRSQRRHVNESDVSTVNASILCDTSKTSVKKLQWDDEISSKEGMSLRNVAHSSNRVAVHSDFASDISSASYNRSERTRNQMEAPKESAHQTKKSASFSSVHSPKKEQSPRPRRSYSLTAVHSQEKNESPSQSKKSASLSLANSLNEEETPRSRRSNSLAASNSQEKYETPRPKRSNSIAAVYSQEKVDIPCQSKKSASFSSVSSLKKEETTRSTRSKSLSSALSHIKGGVETPQHPMKNITISSVESQQNSKTQLRTSMKSSAKVETPRQPQKKSTSFSSVNLLKEEITPRRNLRSNNSSTIGNSPKLGNTPLSKQTPQHPMNNITISSVESLQNSKTQLRTSMKSSAEVETPRQSRKKSTSFSSVNLLKEEITPRRSLRSNNSEVIIGNSPKLVDTPLSKQTTQPSVNSKKKSETQLNEKSLIETPTSQNNVSNPRKKIIKSSSEPNIPLQVKNSRKILSKSTLELSKNKKETPLKLSRNKSISQISVDKNVSNKKNSEEKTVKKKISTVNTKDSSNPKKGNDLRTSVKFTGKSKISKTPAKVEAPASAKAKSLSDKKVSLNKSFKKSSPKKSNISINPHRNCLTAVKTVCKPKVPRIRTLSHPAGGLKIASNSKTPIKISLSKNVKDKSPKKLTSFPKAKVLKEKLHSSMSKIQTTKKNSSVKSKRNSLPSKLPLIRTPKIVAKKPIKSPRVSSKITSKKPIKSPRVSSKITTPKSKISTPTSSKKIVITPKSIVKLSPVGRSSRQLAKNSIKTTPALTPKSALPAPRKALTSIRKPQKLGDTISKRKLDALSLEKSRAAAKKLKAEPAKSLDKKKVAALLMCHKKKSPIKGTTERKLYSEIVKKNLAVSSVSSISSEKKPMRTPNKNITTPKIKKLCFTGVNEATPSNSAIINRKKTPAKSRTPNEDITVDSIPEIDLKPEETFQEDDIFSALYLSRKTSTPAQEVEKPLRRLRSTVNKMKISNSFDSTVNSSSKKHVFFATPIADFAHVKQSPQAGCSTWSTPNVSCLKRTIDPLSTSNIIDESDRKESLNLHSTTSNVDYGNVSCIKNIMHLSPQADYKNVSGLKKVLNLSPQPDYSNVSCLKRNLERSPQADYKNVSGMKKVLNLSPQPDYSNVSCLKRNLERSPQADYKNVSGMKKVLNLSPQPDYSNVSCLKRNLELSPQADYTDVAGVKNLLELKPIPDYSNVSGMKRVFTTSPVANYTDVSGVKQIFTVPPTADYVNTRGLKELRPATEYLNISGVRELFKEPPKTSAEVNEEKVETAAIDEAGTSTSSGPRKLRKRKPKETEEPIPEQQLGTRQVKTVKSTIVQKETDRSAEKLSAEENENKHIPSAVDYFEAGPSTSNVTRNLRRGRSATRGTTHEVIINSVVHSTSGVKQAETRVKKESYCASNKQAPETSADKNSTKKSSRKMVKPQEEIVDLNNQVEPAVVSVSGKPTRRNTRSQISEESKVNVEKLTEIPSRKRAKTQDEIVVLNNQAVPAVASESVKSTRRNNRSQLSMETKVEGESTKKPGRKRAIPQEEIVLNNQSEPAVASEFGKSTRRTTRSQLSKESKVNVGKSPEKPSRKKAKPQEEIDILNNQAESGKPTRKNNRSQAPQSKVNEQTEIALPEAPPTRRATRSKVSAKTEPKTEKRSSVTVSNKSRVRLVSSQETVVNLNNQEEPDVTSESGKPTRKNTRPQASKKSKVNAPEVTTTRRTAPSKVDAKAESKIKRRSSAANKSGVKLVSSLRGIRTTKNAKKKVHFDRSYSRRSTNKGAPKK